MIDEERKSSEHHSHEKKSHEGEESKAHGFVAHHSPIQEFFGKIKFFSQNPSYSRTIAIVVIILLALTTITVSAILPSFRSENRQNAMLAGLECSNAGGKCQSSCTSTQNSLGPYGCGSLGTSCCVAKSPSCTTGVIGHICNSVNQYCERYRNSNCTITTQKCGYVVGQCNYNPSTYKPTVTCNANPYSATVSWVGSTLPVTTVYLSTTASFSTTAQVFTVGSAATLSSDKPGTHTFTGLTSGTTYYVRTKDNFNQYSGSTQFSQSSCSVGNTCDYMNNTLKQAFVGKCQTNCGTAVLNGVNTSAVGGLSCSPGIFCCANQVAQCVAPGSTPIITANGVTSIQGTCKPASACNAGTAQVNPTNCTASGQVCCPPPTPTPTPDASTTQACLIKNACSNLCTTITNSVPSIYATACTSIISTATLGSVPIATAFCDWLFSNSAIKQGFQSYCQNECSLVKDTFSNPTSTIDCAASYPAAVCAYACNPNAYISSYSIPGVLLTGFSQAYRNACNSYCNPLSIDACISAANACKVTTSTPTRSAPVEHFVKYACSANNQCVISSSGPYDTQDCNGKCVTTGVKTCTDAGGCNGSGGGGTPACQNGLATAFSIAADIPGLGNGSFENSTPKHPQRNVQLSLIDASSNNSAAITPGSSATFSLGTDGKISFNNVGLGNGLVCANAHKIGIRIPGSLRVLSQNVQYGKDQNTNALSVTLPMGDIVDAGNGIVVSLGGNTYGDNRIDINDYNIMRQCLNANPTADQTITFGTQTVHFTCGDTVNLLDYQDGGTQESINTASGIDEWGANYNTLLRNWIQNNGVGQ